MKKKMKKKSIQIYVTEEGKKAALEITKKAKKKKGTKARQAAEVSEVLIFQNIALDRIDELVKKVEELEHIIESLKK